MFLSMELKARLVASDLPGFGRSKDGFEFMSFEAQGNFLDKFVKAIYLININSLSPDGDMAASFC
jgi:hypothetical protein